MGKYFNDCKTIEELNSTRTGILAELNNEYGVKRKELINSVKPYKPIIIFKSSSVPDPEPLVYQPFMLAKEPAHANEIRFLESQEVMI